MPSPIHPVSEQPVPACLFAPSDAERKAVLDALTTEYQTTRQIADRSRVNFTDAWAILSELDFLGIAEKQRIPWCPPDWRLNQPDSPERQEIRALIERQPEPSAAEVEAFSNG